MTSLPEFILARVSELEATANDVHERYCNSLRPVMPYQCGCGNPARVLDDCKSKRAIVEVYVETRKSRDALNDMFGDPDYDAVMGPLRDVLLHMTQPHADHAAFERAWAL